MKEGTMEIQKQKLAAPCGLYCGACSIRIAHRDDNHKLKERLSAAYGVHPEEIRCEGCFSASRPSIPIDPEAFQTEAFCPRHQSRFLVCIRSSQGKASSW
jgi:hypothetical protein